MVYWSPIPHVTWRPTSVKRVYSSTTSNPKPLVKSQRNRPQRQQALARSNQVSSTVIDSFCMDGYATSSQSQMKSVWRFYVQSCRATSIACLPLSKASVCGFIWLMTQENYAYNSVDRFIKHVYAYNKVLNGPQPSSQDLFWINLALRSSGKILGKGSVVRAHTLTMNQVVSVSRVLSEEHSVMFILGTCALLRLNELLNLSRDCVTFTDEALLIKIKASKTDIFSAGVTIPLGCSGGKSCTAISCSAPLCVPHMLKRWLVKNRLLKNDSLFHEKECNSFADSLADALYSLMGDRVRCTSHCMRRSGAVMAFRKGMRLEEIAILGRWSGTETLTAHYLRDSSDETSRIANEVARVWSSSVSSGCGVRSAFPHLPL